MPKGIAGIAAQSATYSAALAIAAEAKRIDNQHPRRGIFGGDVAAAQDRRAHRAKKLALRAAAITIARTYGDLDPRLDQEHWLRLAGFQD